MRSLLIEIKDDKINRNVHQYFVETKFDTTPLYE